VSLLERFDHDGRFAAEFPGLRREETDTVVRHIDFVGHSGVVIFSRLSVANADRSIQEQIAFFEALPQDFEWKAYAHDAPADLVTRLGRLGFDVDESEAVMVTDLQSAPALDPLTDTAITVRRIGTRAELADVAAVKQRVYGHGAAELLDQLGYELDNAPHYLSVYVAEMAGTPAATAWIRFPSSSAFASLWGGSTLPEQRNRGLYTALLAARLAEARARGVRYVTVDARAMSRPILEKRGFAVLTHVTACVYRSGHG
jgi:GNAT superfamily N-acetyltransferase